MSLQARETARDSLKASVALKNRGINEEELFGFVRSYLSEVFPNPQQDCPPDSDRMSMTGQPSQAAPAHLSQHLTCSSPCFNRVETLADLKKVGKPDIIASRSQFLDCRPSGS